MVANVITRHQQFGMNAMFLESIELQQKVYDHYVFSAKLGTPTLLHGIVRGIIELGYAKSEYTPRQHAQIECISVQDELEEIYNDAVVYFDEAPKFRRRKQYALVIEFPDIVVDPSRILCGISNPMSLRLTNCGINYSSEQTTVFRPLLASWRYYETENGRKTTMSEFCTLYRMLLNRNLIKEGKRIIPDHIGRLLDESFMFSVQLYHYNARYVKSKIFFRNEYKLDTPVQSKQGFYIGFNRDNDLNALKSLETHVINTIKRSDQYSGSLIEQQILQLESEYANANHQR